MPRLPLPPNEGKADKAIIILCASLAITSLFCGLLWSEIGFIITALYVWLIRLDSRYSFLIALVLLISIPAFELLGQFQYKDAIAVYVFYALCIGVGGAIIELRD
jgi:hypothetical protein